MMQRFLRMAAVVVAAGVFAGLAGSAGAATFTDSLTGVEVAFSSTQGTFTGVATGRLPGGWLAVVDHTKLSPNATITGGSFTLATVFNGLPATVSGQFAGGGSVTLINPGLNCSNQKFTVADSLTGVSGDGHSGGTGVFAATLTHHRIKLFGQCITYAATVKGTLALSL